MSFRVQVAAMRKYFAGQGSQRAFHVKREDCSLRSSHRTGAIVPEINDAADSRS